MSINKFQYPVTEKTLHKYAESIFTPIKRGECVTTVWAPMAGRKMWNKFIIDNIQLFAKELPFYKRYSLVYVEPMDLTEETLAGYIRLMARSFLDSCKKTPDCEICKVSNVDVKIFNDEGASYSQLLDKFRSLLRETTDGGVNVVFFVGEFDELKFATSTFYNNLKSIWSQLYPRIHYVFLMRDRVTRTESISQWSELNEAILQNIVYVGLRGEDDVDYVIDYNSSQHELILSTEERKVIKLLCGGHPYMLKVAVRVISNLGKDKLTGGKLTEYLLNYYELRSVALAIYNVRGEKEKKIIKEVASGKISSIEKDKERLSFLLNIGIVIKTASGSYELFGELFKNVVLESDNQDERPELVEGGLLSLDKETEVIQVAGRGVEECFSPQEYLVIANFLKSPGKLCGREDIGEIIWGKESYEKYSDWAIDQLMSKLRRKIKDLGLRQRLITIRGKGYKLSY